MKGPAFALFETAIGPCGAVWNERGLAGVLLPERSRDATRARLLARYPGARETRPAGDAKRAIDAMRAHLAGDLDALLGLELDYAAVPLFYRRVYEALRAVPPGATVGYGELAARVGSPGAARAVGQAVGKNPFPVVVPCHRVLAAQGRAGGFSAHGGVKTKAALLAIEGVTLAMPTKKRTAYAKKTAAPATKLASSAEQTAPTATKPAKRAARAALELDLVAAVAHLTKADPRLAKIIAKVGPPTLRPDGTASPFEALVRSIVYQQLNGTAAGTIHGRVLALFPDRRIAPELLLAMADDALRGAGLSRGKLAALRDLAAKTLDGTVPPLRALHALEDDAIVERLVQVRGIGRWTVEMLLIFRLGRPDVLPVADYGVRNGFRLAYGKKEMPTPKELEAHGEKWRPYRSIASWYLWRAVDLLKEKKPVKKEKKAAEGRKRDAKRG